MWGAQARTEEWVKAIAIKMQEHCLGLPQETLDRALAVIGQAIEDLVDCALVSLYQLRSPLQLLAEFEALKTSRGAGERQSAEDTLVRAYVAFIDDYEHSLARWESDSERLLDFARGGLNSLFKTQTFDLREAMCLALAEAKRLAKGCYWRYLHSLLDRIERPRAEVGKSDIVSVTLSERMHCVEFPRGVRVPQPDRARLAEKMSSFAYSSSFPAAFAGDPRYEYEASAFRELTSEIEHLGTRALRFFETLDYVAAFGRGELSGVRTPLAEIEKAFHLRRAWLKQVFAHLDEVVRNGTAGKSRAFLDEIRKTLLGYRTALIHPESEVIFDAPNAAPLKRYAVELFRSLSLGLPEDALSTHFLPTAASRAGSVFGDIARIMKNLEVGFRPPDGY